jgi:hypothetical protein
VTHDRFGLTEYLLRVCANLEVSHEIRQVRGGLCRNDSGPLQFSFFEQADERLLELVSAHRCTCGRAGAVPKTVNDSSQGGVSLAGAIESFGQETPLSQNLIGETAVFRQSNAMLDIAEVFCRIPTSCATRGHLQLLIGEEP